MYVYVMQIYSKLTKSYVHDNTVQFEVMFIFTVYH